MTGNPVNIFTQNTPLDLLYSLATLLPTIGVAIRRMHDTNHRGWWLIVPFVDVVFLFFKSDAGSNRFGDNPINTNEGLAKQPL